MTNVRDTMKLECEIRKYKLLIKRIQDKIDSIDDGHGHEVEFCGLEWVEILIDGIDRE